MDFYIDPTDYPCSEKIDGSKCIGPDKCNSETCPLAAKGNDDDK